MRPRHIAREGFGPTALALLTAALLIAAPARGQILDAGSQPPTAADGQADPRTEQIRALIAGTLDPAVEPRALFDVTLSDEGVVAVERARLELLLQRLDAAAVPRPPLAASDEGASRPADGAVADLADTDGAALRRRVALDRARLEFYSLPRAKRDALLAEHAARQAGLARAESEEQRRVRESEAELARSLATAQSARDEAERLVAEELARLIRIERDVEALRETFRSEHGALAARSVGLLAWQRRVRAAISSGASAADETYARLREALGAVHGELAAALDGSESRLPKLGADALRVLQAEVSIEQVRTRRKRIEDALATARREEQALHDERAAILLSELKVLNRERLRLLPYLSLGPREAITGFTQVGFEHARLEADHLLLVLRHHRRVATDWLASLRARDQVAGPSIWHVSAVAVPWLLATIAFVWWRRRSPALLAVGEARIAELERAERRPQPSPLRRGLRVLRDVHRSLEWLAFYGVMVWLLPAGAHELMEVQLLVVVLGWSFAAAFVVNGINALAGAAKSTASQRGNAAGALRLRSLRLVGRVAVALFLILLLTSRLVGEGTVYHWVASVRWLAAVVVFLILVRWWRETVFERIERARRKSRMQAWVLANRIGWKSFFAAMIGAVQLFSVGAYKVLRNWLTGFDLARRAHAYLFKREIDRLASGKSAAGAATLGAEAFAALSPERTGGLWVACPADELLQSLRARLSRGQGGIVALIGGRGLGKSTLLTALAAHAPNALRIDCGDADPVTRVREACSARNQKPAGALELVLLDDVQCLVKPTRSGLRAFDEVLALARAPGGSTLWVFAIDSVVWPFLRRARDGRPLFDEVHVMEPWTDEQIGELLSRRCAEAQVVPTFEDLLERLPASADEIDRQEALSAKRAGYFRMVWDYARGNPAMALEVWRCSLDHDEGGRARVRPLGAPNASELEALPDPALFILRAVLQMTPASVSDVAQVTRLSEAQVENALRFGEAHGYVVREDGKVRVAWRWLRSVLLLLERRRLLVNP